MPLKQHLLLAGPHHCLSATHGLALQNTHTQCTLTWTAGGRQGKSDEEWRVGGMKKGEGGRDGGNKGREGGSDAAREGGREG